MYIEYLMCTFENRLYSLGWSIEYINVRDSVYKKETKSMYRRYKLCMLFFTFECDQIEES